jgi:hypothetical protein
VYTHARVGRTAGRLPTSPNKRSALATAVFFAGCLTGAVTTTLAGAPTALADTVPAAPMWELQVFTVQPRPGAR